MRTEPTPKPSAGPFELREVLAYELHRQAAQDNASALKSWQTDQDTRSLYREQADAVLKQLGINGVRLAASSSKDVLARLDYLRTVPAYQAYELSQELPKAEPAPATV